MYNDLLPYLCCPACRKDLAICEAVYDTAGEIVAGQLVCSACSSSYRVHEGIADFLGSPRPPTLTQLINELPPTAWVYERLWRPFALTLLSGEPFPYWRELPLITGLATPERGGLIIDLACSNGLYARSLAHRQRGVPGHVAGVDHALPMLQEARRRALREGLQISYIRAKAQALPFCSNSAATVAIGGSLNEIGDAGECLAEVHRILRAGGACVSMTLTRADMPVGRAMQQLMGIAGVRFWSAEQLVELFAQQGLRISGQWQYGIVVFMHALLLQ